MCWVYCPEGIIGRGERYSIDYDYCKGCGVCAEECPRSAITMMREE
jgi:pyruvate ferredoxin oxidoreductase delta subunit